MMQRFAAVAGLRRRVILGVPVLSPGLSSLWVGWVTPVPASIARPLVRSLRTEVVCAEHDVARWLPDPPEGLLPFDTAVRYALARVRDRDVETRWSTAAVSGSIPTDPGWAGGSLYSDDRSIVVDAPPERLWRVIEGIGGENGWYSWPLAWSARGWLDTAVGGVGLRRGRRDPQRLHIGEALDFWRVEDVVEGRLLRLRAEMRLPGQAWLELRVDRRAGRPADPDAAGPVGTDVDPDAAGTAGAAGAADPDTAGQTVLRQRALFRPRGLAGHLYWHAVSPFHAAVFGGMLRNIARGAEHDGGSPAWTRDRTPGRLSR
jgi:hypothetical protein